MSSENNWQTICQTGDLVQQSGVCALLENKEQVAIFYLGGDTVYAISNFDPFGKANVLYRGLIGETKGELYVASPLLKQRFLLANGKCLEDDTKSIKSYDIRITGEKVEILA